MTIGEAFERFTAEADALPDEKETWAALEALLLAVAEEAEGYYLGACGEHCTSAHEHCAMKEYEALKARIKALWPISLHHA